MALWVETCAQYPPIQAGKRTSRTPPRGADPSQAGPLSQQQLDRVRQLLSDGAGKKALQLLNSAGLHDPSDPHVLARLKELHPPPHEQLPLSLPVTWPVAMREDIHGFWEPRVATAILHFPRDTW